MIASLALCAGLLAVAASLSYKLSLAGNVGLFAATVWPRLLMLAGAGLALGLSGAIDRALHDRPAREVYIFAVSLGAAQGGGVLAVAGGMPMLLVGAAGGGVLGAGLAWLLTRAHRLLVIALALALSAGGYVMLFAAGYGRGNLAPERELIFWLLGDASGAGWPGGSLVALAGLALVGRAFGLARGLDSLGAARGSLAALSLIAWGVSVGAVGPVAFVGLFSPLLARAFAGERPPAQALLLSALSCAVCLVMLDSVARALAGGLAYPLNMQALIVFGPAFLWLWGRRLRQQGAPPTGRWPGVLSGVAVAVVGVGALAAVAFAWSLKLVLS